MADTKITADRNSSNMEIQQHKVNTSLENVKEVPLTNNPRTGITSISKNGTSSKDYLRKK